MNPAFNVVLPAAKPGIIAPTIVVDTREQTPLVFRRLQSVRGTLTSGDYSILGAGVDFAVERKTIADLVGCITGDNRERLEREFLRLRGYAFRRLLIVGRPDDLLKGGFHSSVRPASALASVAAWEARFELPVAWIPNPQLAAEQIESWASWYAREVIFRASAITNAVVEDMETAAVCTGAK